MILSKKNNKPNHPPLKMNNSELQKVDNHKHLGVIFSNNGFWHDHVDYIVKKIIYSIKHAKESANDS